jgi:hypothetical protein
MASKQSNNVWKDAIDSLHFTDTIETVQQKLAELNPDYTFEQFITDCEAFYDLYIDFIGFNDDKSPSKNLQIQFHKVARLLNMYGHAPDQVEEDATQSMFDYLAANTDQPAEVSKTASSHEDQDDFHLQGNLAFGLATNMTTDNVDRVELVEGKPKVSQCRILNVRVASEDLAFDTSYISKLADLYKIGDNLLEVKFNRDKMICSLYYS